MMMMCKMSFVLATLLLVTPPPLSLSPAPGMMMLVEGVKVPSRLRRKVVTPVVEVVVDDDKAVNNKYGHREMQLIGIDEDFENGLLENMDCIPIIPEFVQEETDEECLQMGGCSTGCCRLLGNKLTCDSNNSLPQLECICNSNTRYHGVYMGLTMTNATDGVTTLWSPPPLSNGESRKKDDKNDKGGGKNKDDDDEDDEDEDDRNEEETTGSNIDVTQESPAGNIAIISSIQVVPIEGGGASAPLSTPVNNSAGGSVPGAIQAPAPAPAPGPANGMPGLEEVRPADSEETAPAPPITVDESSTLDSPGDVAIITAAPNDTTNNNNSPTSDSDFADSDVFPVPADTSEIVPAPQQPMVTTPPAPAPIPVMNGPMTGQPLPSFPTSVPFGNSGTSGVSPNACLGGSWYWQLDGNEAMRCKVADDCNQGFGFCCLANFCLCGKPGNDAIAKNCLPGYDSESLQGSQSVSVGRNSGE